MGIPIKKYIDISTAALNTQGGNRDYSGLLFVTTAMKSEVPEAYEDLAEKYADGDVCTFTNEAIGACFADTSDVAAFAAKYFGYVNEFGISPDRLHIVKYTGSVSASVFTDVIAKFSNFGAFTMLEAGNANVAASNASFGRQYVYVCGNTSGTPVVGKVSGTHFMKFGEISDLADPVAWVATRDYTRTNGAGTIDYTEFPLSEPTVDTGTEKDTLDAANVNYIGHVQQRGINRSFYQRGVNMDGIDLGVYCDSAWIQSEIEAGWINMALGAAKIPANKAGMLRVRAMIIDVAERALYNGCILMDKPLTTTQETEVNVFANDDDAATSVESNGYYISTRLLQDSEAKWVCQYILIYAKGDHIEKVVGQHLLV